MELWLQRLVRNGNAVAVNVPRPALAALGLVRGDQIVITVRGNQLVVARATPDTIVPRPPDLTPTARRRARAKR